MKDRSTGETVREIPRIFNIATTDKKGKYNESWAKRQLQKVTFLVMRRVYECMKVRIYEYMNV